MYRRMPKKIKPWFFFLLAIAFSVSDTDNVLELFLCFRNESICTTEQLTSKIFSICVCVFLWNIKWGGKWYLEKRGSRKIWPESRNLENVSDKSQSLVFAWFVFTFFESRNLKRNV